MDVRLCSFNKYHIDAIIQEEEEAKWRFTGFYKDPCPDRKHLSWTVLRHLKAMNNLTWLVGGDFNSILLTSEKRRGSPKSKTEMMNFHDALNNCALRDLGWSPGGWFTWSNRWFRDGLIQERLDRFVCSNDLFMRFQHSKVTNLNSVSSDHYPILV